MLYGVSSGLLALGIAFLTQGNTRLVGIFWLLAAATLSFGEWRKRNRLGKGVASPGTRPIEPGQ
jgi:hypothetical protein